MDPAVIDQMIDLARTAAQAEQDTSGPASPGPASTAPATDGGAAADGADDADGAQDADPAGDAGPAEQGRARTHGLSPEAWRALRHAMARLAVDLVSGPAGVAAILRQGLLDQPYNTPSLPLDIGYSDSIPWYIRRAVLLRDRKCAWPKCGRPAVYCDVHHLRHKEDGGETALDNLVLVCQLCRRRHNWHYAELWVMPGVGFPALVGGGGRAVGVGIIRGFRGRPGAGRAGGSGRGRHRAGWSGRVPFP
jgi:hypothetical protein